METITITNRIRSQIPSPHPNICLQFFIVMWAGNYLEIGLTRNSVHYTVMAWDKLKSEIQSKHQYLKDVLLLHDSVRRRIVNHSVQTLHWLRFKALQHLPYRLDLTPSDNYPSSPIHNILRDHQYITAWSERCIHVAEGPTKMFLVGPSATCTHHRAWNVLIKYILKQENYI